MSYIGNPACQYNALQPYIRCAVNPSGPCEGCRWFEINPAYVLASPPEMSRRESLAHKAKVKLFGLSNFLSLPAALIRDTSATAFIMSLLTTEAAFSAQVLESTLSRSLKIVVSLYLLHEFFLLFNEVFVLFDESSYLNVRKARIRLVRLGSWTILLAVFIRIYFNS